MRDLKKFMLLGVTTQSISHKEMEKAISKKKCFLITSAQSIKAFFLKEEARENFSV